MTSLTASKRIYDVEVPATGADTMMVVEELNEHPSIDDEQVCLHCMDKSRMCWQNRPPARAYDGA